MVKKQPVFRNVIIVFLLAAMITSCQLNVFGNETPDSSFPYPLPPTPTPQPMAEIFFAATLPAPLLPGESLLLSVVDEITGLAINPKNYTMQSGDSLHYYVAIPLVVNSVLKYRYIKQSAQTILEDTSDEQAVRYRLYFVGGPGEVMDTISSWSDVDYFGDVGRITGRVVSGIDNSGLQDILICAGGAQTLTDSNGEFVLEGITTGIHNMVAYSLDGRYQTFQQGAFVTAGKRTPVNIIMTPAELVSVVFTVMVPSNTVPSAPIRFAGNLYQLGNSFGDLQGGTSSVSDKMPQLTPMLDGRYTLSLMLPAGADIQYKYTLGDGFWNAEHQISGEFKVRQLIVPNSGGIVQDVVETWQAGSSAPILFEVTAPPETPQTDTVSIQFNPYGWTEPLQMWSLGNNHWVYQLFSPFNLLSSFEYRYCRNDQCGMADDSATSGRTGGRLVSTSSKPQAIKDTINSWKWLSKIQFVDDPSQNIQAKAYGFWAGVEFQSDNYSPSWQPRMPLALKNIQEMGSNWVILTPSWSYQGEDQIQFSQIPSKDQLSVDLSETVNWAKGYGLNTAIFPTANFPIAEEDWWMNATRDANWWDSWFTRYRAFSLYYADLAMSNGSAALILGGGWLKPALPGGILADGSSSNLPLDSETRWSSLIAEIRQHYNGQLLWAIEYPGSLINPPGLIYELDGIYLLWSAPLSNSIEPSLQEMQTNAGNMMDDEVRPFQLTYEKPIIVSIAYASITGSAKACVPDEKGGCEDWSILNQPNSINEFVELNLQAQSDVYKAILNAINERSWISGFVSRGFFPPVSLQDTSASINGKPAENLLDYWFPRLLGNIQ